MLICSDPPVGACSPPGHTASSWASSSRTCAAVIGCPFTSAGSWSVPDGSAR